ncbi:L-xylulose reductase [Orchesella cincta]|uniref:L-xylulose reductase n=1 Tax=Orchesella cincta TaxID=48709 RepID=A0A1D2MHR7_ORCCI|nr:L-xylulose reductase [Orchesella cincta]
MRIGRQLVQRFHDDKAIVFAIDKNVETIGQLSKELPSVTAVVVDLADWTPREKHFDVNVLACIYVAQTAARKMIDSGTGGTFVNVCSLAAKAAVQCSSMYCASKSALEMLTKSMAVELGPHNIRANCIAPGLVNSPMSQSIDPTMKAKIDQLLSRNAIKRPIDPNEIADLVMFLLSPLSAMITGESVVIDGGTLASFI